MREYDRWIEKYETLMKFKIKGRPPASLIMLEDNPYTTMNYYEDISKYQKLCEEVQYILQEGIKMAKIEVSAITYRVKSMESFARKFINKAQKSSIYEIKDIAGVRLVHLYRSDFPAIEEILQTKFKVLQKKDKIKSRQVDEFGYNAVHFLVTLKEKYAGARYVDLKDLICEIQVRTVMQDAWAIIEHHLAYRQKQAVPKILKRELLQLSAILENADNQFDRIRNECEKYISTIEKTRRNKNKFFDFEINIVTLKTYFKIEFPTKQLSYGDSQIAVWIGELYRAGYKKIADIENLLKKTAVARQKLHRNFFPAGKADPFAALIIALGLSDKRFRNRFSSRENAHLDRYRHLVKKK